MRSIALMVLGIVTACAPALLAQEGAPDPVLARDLEALGAAIRERVAKVEKEPGPDGEGAAQALERYRAALEILAGARTALDEAKVRSEQRREAPGRAAAARKALAAEPPAAESPPAGATLARWSEALEGARVALDLARREAEGLSQEGAQLGARRAEAPKLLAAAQEKLEKLKAERAAARPGAGPADPAEAALFALDARVLAARIEIAALDGEVLGRESMADLNALRQELALRQVRLAEQRVAAFQRTVEEKRLTDAEEGVRRAREAAEKAAAFPEALRALAVENLSLAGRRTGPEGTAARLKEAQRTLQEVRGRLEELRKEFQNTRQRVETVGMSPSIGLLLRKRRAGVPDPAAYRKSGRRRQARIEAVQWELIDLEEQAARLGDPAERVTSLLNGLPAADRGPLGPFVRDLVASHGRLLETVRTETNALFLAQVDLDAAEEKMASAADDYAAFIDERVLWVRSAAPFAVSDFARAAEGILDATSPDNAADLGRAIRADVAGRPLVHALGVLLLAGLLVFRRKASRRLAESADRRPERFSATVEALAITAFLALPWPGLAIFLGWRIGASSDGGAFARAFGAGLFDSGILFLALEGIRQLVREKGLGDGHFKWPAESLRALRLHLLWFLPAAVPVVFFAATVAAWGNAAAHDSLGRLLLMAGLLLLGAFLTVVPRPSGPFTTGLLARRRQGWADRSRNLWFVLLLLAPLLLCALAGFGYVYSVESLAAPIVRSGGLLLAVLLAGELVRRWLFIVRRRLALEIRVKRDTGLYPAPGGAPPQAEHEAPAEDAAALDLSALRVQSLRILRTFSFAVLVVGLYLIWADVVPALGGLKRVELWSVVSKVTEAVPAADGTVRQVTSDGTVPITLADLLLGFLFAGLTVIGMRNLPGLLEAGLLNRLPVDPGSRYAIRTIFMYLLALVGTILAVGALGIRWSGIQWLVAAMGVGLGFGLQEIFANFVSGLILLFERPIRLGDTVTVGSVTGVVTRIRIRATTIRDWDRKELVIPNREFITGQLINWTLSDTIIRVVIPVGVAYGADTERARAILLDLARDHADVLKDPEPVSLFLEFGDSALNLELRVFVPAVGSILKVRNELNTAIDKAFKDAGIEIAFPQRDLHIRSVDAAAADALCRREKSGGA